MFQTDVEKMNEAAKRHPILTQNLLSLDRDTRQRTIEILKAGYTGSGDHEVVEVLRRIEGYAEYKTLRQLR